MLRIDTPDTSGSDLTIAGFFRSFDRFFPRPGSLQNRFRSNDRRGSTIRSLGKPCRLDCLGLQATLRRTSRTFAGTPAVQERLVLVGRFFDSR